MDIRSYQAGRLAANGARLIRRYTEMAKNSLVDRLKALIDEAEGSDFKVFAVSLRRDYEAVHAAFSEPWSTRIRRRQPYQQEKL
jgi:hypothetical protein